MREQRGDVGIPLVDVLHEHGPVARRQLREIVLGERAAAQGSSGRARGRARRVAHSASSSQARPARSFGRQRIAKMLGMRRAPAAAASASSRAGTRRRHAERTIASRDDLDRPRHRERQIDEASFAAAPMYVAGVSASRRFFASSGSARPPMNACSASRVMPLAARERLQLLVRFRQAVAAHHGLHGFGQHFPAGIEIGGEARGIDVELAEAAQQRFERDQRVAERGAERAQHGRVGEVALPARDRQLLARNARTARWRCRNCLRHSRSRSG